MLNTSRKNSNWMINNPLALEISRGNVSGYSDLHCISERVSIQANPEGCDVWQGTAFQIPTPNQLGGERVSVMSSSYDDRANGTGASAIDIYYLDATGYEQEERIALNGTAIVNSIGTNIRFINDFHIANAGVGGVSSGNITVFSFGTTTRVYNQINVGLNNGLSSLKMVPKGKTFYFDSEHVSVSGTPDARVAIRTTSFMGERHGTTFIDLCSMNLQQTAIFVKHIPPHKIPELCQIKATAYTVGAGAGANISVGYEGYLIDDE